MNNVVFEINISFTQTKKKCRFAASKCAIVNGQKEFPDTIQFSNFSEEDLVTIYCLKEPAKNSVFNRMWYVLCKPKNDRSYKLIFTFIGTCDTKKDINNWNLTTR